MSELKALGTVRGCDGVCGGRVCCELGLARVDDSPPVR